MSHSGRRFRLACLAAVVAGHAVAQSALPKPGKIIDDYLKAEGGVKLLANIRTESVSGNLTEKVSGRSGSYSLITKAPNRFYLETVTEPDHEITAYNGMSAWEQNPAEGARTLTGAASQEAGVWGRYWNSRLVDPKKDKLALQVVGIEDVRGHPAYHLRVALAPKLARDVFFDTTSHLILREIGANEQFDYDDYRRVNGIQTPFRIELRRGGREWTVSVTRAEFNGPVEDSLFAFPRHSDSPLPDMVSLLSQINKNQKSVEELKKQYTCHLATEEESSDPDGKTKSGKEFEVFYVGESQVRRLVAKEGKPLDEKERKKEEERFNKEFERLTRKQAELAADPKKQKKQEEEDEAALSKFLRAWSFDNARRERFRGHDVLAIDFGPNPNYKPKGMEESLAHRLAGVMWIDEQALEIVRAEARFTDSMKIGGGVLASLDKGSNVVWEQAKVNDEVWLPVYDEIHIAGRLLFLKARANLIDRYSDYKKFQADSKVLTTEPK